MCTIKGNSEFVDWLINSHTDADYPEKASQLINAIDDEGKSPLHAAAEKGEHSANLLYGVNSIICYF